MFKIELLSGERVVEIFRQTRLGILKIFVIVFLAIVWPWQLLSKHELLSEYRRLFIFWTAFWLVYGAYRYLLWRLNASLLTDKRFIAVKYHSLLDKKVWETGIEKIVHISIQTKGLWQSLSRSGNVEIQLFGLNEPFILKNVRRPERIKNLILEQTRKK